MGKKSPQLNALSKEPSLNRVKGINFGEVKRYFSGIKFYEVFFKFYEVFFKFFEDLLTFANDSFFHDVEH